MRLCNTFQFIKNCRRFFLRLNIFFSIWSCWCSCLCHAHKLSFRRILIILLRPPPVHALFENVRFNKDGLKNKREYTNKPERNLVRIILFINNDSIYVAVVIFKVFFSKCEDGQSTKIVNKSLQNIHEIKLSLTIYIGKNSW